LKSNLISKSETDDLLKQVSAQWKIEIPKAKNLKMHRIMDNVQIFTANDIMILKIEETYLPFLSQTSLLEKFPHVLVDMGAVKFMCMTQFARITSFAAASNPSRSNDSSASTYPLDLASFSAISKDIPFAIFVRM